LRLGIDLGGTKIEAIALDADGTSLIRRRVATPVGDYAATLAAVRDLVEAIERDVSRKGSVGIGCPGALSTRTGKIKNANSTVLNGKALDADLARILGRPVRLENDANCFALSEASDGAGRDEKLVFGIILGTGVGGGLVVDQALIRGRNRLTGEWGHNPLPWPRDDEWPGPHCYCGKTGCIETFLSGAGLARDYKKLRGLDLSAHDIAQAAQVGDVDARECLTLYRDRLARALASVINIVDPDAIVFGGGLSNIEALYVDLGARIERYAFSDAIDTKFCRAVHGDSSGVRGAAWLWPKNKDK
jgi:fructokinase